MFEHTNMSLDLNKEELHHTDMNQSQSTDLLCPICNSQHTNETNLYNHLHVHTEDVRRSVSQSKATIEENLNESMVRPFKCQPCDLTFDRASQLDYHHRSIHLGEKSQLCEICGKGFFRKTDLRTHLNIHLKTNLWICEICGRKFNHISNLIRHCRMHAGLKPYPCSICGKRFTQISSLARHKRIHERCKETTNQQLHKADINIDVQQAEHGTNKDESVVGNPLNHRKIMKRQHYCKICGESFSFIFLLRQHGKCHAENTIYLKCKSCEKEIKELEEHICHGNDTDEMKDTGKNWEETTRKYKSDKNKDFGEPETDVIKNILPLESIIYITSEQFKRINLEHMEDCAIDLAEKHQTGTLSDKDTEFIIPEVTVPNNYNTQSVNDNHLVLYKSNDLTKKSNVIYIHQLDKSNIAVLEKNKGEEIESGGTSLDTYKLKYDDKRVNAEINLYPHKYNKLFTEEKVIHKSLGCKSLSVHDDALCTQVSDSLTQKLNDIENNTAINIPDNVSDLFQKTDLPLDSNANVHAKTEFIDKKNNELNSMQTDKNLEINNIGNREEPMLRLVQTETGQQFYEFIISNLAEKLPNVHRNRHDEIANVPENLCNAPESIKDIGNEQIQPEQDLQDIADIHSDLNYAQYGLQGEEKSFSASHALLENDPQVDFDRYVETNFEVFERLTYENNSERFFEFVEIAEGTPDISTLKESPMVRFVQNEGEHFFELLQDSQMVNKNESQDFLQIHHTQPNENISDDNANEQILLSCLKDNELTDDARCEVNTNENSRVTSEKKMEDEEDAESIHNEETVSQETKKGKIFLIKFQCTVCEKSFSTGYNYKQHIGTHFADQQKFHCKECKLSFAWKSTLNKHIANNHRPDGPQKFVCDICPRVYNTLSQVNEHVKRDHLKQRDHICSHCGKSFFKKYDLKIHNRIHTDERPYVCRACGKRFHHRSHIIRHERIHF